MSAGLTVAAAAKHTTPPSIGKAIERNFMTQYPIDITAQIP
jgi:hypothetical protein